MWRKRMETLWLSVVLFASSPPSFAAADMTTITLTPSQMRDDLVYFRDVWAPLDKSFSVEDRKVFDGIVASAIRNVDSLTPAEFALTVGRAAAAAHNGHTLAALQSWPGFHGLPFKACWFKDGLYIVRVHPQYAELLGARIEQLGPLTPEIALQRVAPYISGTPARVRDLSPSYLRLLEILRHIGATSSDRSVNVRIVAHDGKTRIITLNSEPTPDPEGLSPSQQFLKGAADSPIPGRWIDVLDPISPLPPSYGPPVDISSQWLSTEAHILYLRSTQIVDGPGEKPLWLKMQDIFYHEVLDEHEHVRPRSVIVDLRFNSGGNFLEMVLLSKSLPRILPDNGKVFVLVGPGTFSAALVTAAMLKGSGRSRVVIIGDTMGDAPQFWSEGREMALPNSQLWVEPATAYHDWANGCDDANRCYWANVAFAVKSVSLTPEIQIIPTFSEYAAGLDPVLDKAISLARQQ